ncbi:hypothetical protein ACFYV7_22715 [Nocardia suismassiliense]|uniref:NAD(P)-dependent dehydrogenase, short-chain alcohol dehydrogenase family n=1 Tax=Nocardia suismassiliense TaxID=2077092 RepID=A0ABW6QWK0_9NOCA
MTQFEDRVAIVTGGSRGIGKARCPENYFAAMAASGSPSVSKPWEGA